MRFWKKLLLTDAQLKKRLPKAIKADREDLWKELHDIGMFFALVGATSEALSLWTFAYSGPVPMPSKDDLAISVHGDAAISAVCFGLKLPDLSKGVPPRMYPKKGKNVAMVGTLAKRVRYQDRWIRWGLTLDAWSGCNLDGSSPELVALAFYRKARLLAETEREGDPSDTEMEALAVLKVLLEDEQAVAALHPNHRLQALLLAVDIAVRHRLLEEGRTFFRQWYDYIVHADIYGTSEEAFGLISVVGLMCQRVLSDKTKLQPTERTQLVKTFLRELAARLAKPDPPKASKWKYNVGVSYGQFYLEPLKGDPRATYFQETGESEQGFSAFPCQVAFGTPGDTMDCLVEVEFGTQLPPLEKAVQAVAVPLTVKDSHGLYLRNVLDSGNKSRLEVPKGRYDVVARFFPRKLKKNEGTCFDSWQVILTFLPQGTVGAKCLKLDFGTPPQRLVLHQKK